jgi:hypothetical protein
MAGRGVKQSLIEYRLNNLRAHPCFDRCVRIYRNALIDWNASGAIQNAAKTLGQDRRAYCDARLSANQFQWFAAGTGEEFTRQHVELAYIDAVEQASV